MGYKIVFLSFEEAKKRIKQYTYGLAYLFSEILLGKTETIENQICWEDCIEARFFSEQEELHIFDYNGERKAVCVKDEEKENKFEYIYEKRYKLNEYFRKNGYQYFKVKEYIGCDEDGQAVIELTRLVGLE